MNPKHPPGPPMTLGNMREQDVLKVLSPLLFQQIANFCQQHDLRCWSRRGSWGLCRFQFIDPLDRDEQRDSEKLAPAEHCALLLRVGV
jgi:hypothetical protein